MRISGRALRLAIGATLLTATIAVTSGIVGAHLATSGKPTSTVASAETRVSAAATSAAPSTAALPVANQRMRFCSTEYGFCAKFDTLEPVRVNTATTKTTQGPRKTMAFEGANESVHVYTPGTKDARKALEADLAWSWPHGPLTHVDPVSGTVDPATLMVTTAEQPTPDDTQVDVAYKVFHKGRVYVLLIVAPDGLDQALEFTRTLTFVTTTPPNGPR